MPFRKSLSLLWFDVEIEGITTREEVNSLTYELWFDVEIEGITTIYILIHKVMVLWFDVEIEGITTKQRHR